MAQTNTKFNQLQSVNRQSARVERSAAAANGSTQSQRTGGNTSSRSQPAWADDANWNNSQDNWNNRNDNWNNAAGNGNWNDNSNWNNNENSAYDWGRDDGHDSFPIDFNAPPQDNYGPQGGDYYGQGPAPNGG